MKTIRMEIAEASNGFVVRVAPAHDGMTWESAWIANDLKHLAEVITTQLVIKEFVDR